MIASRRLPSSSASVRSPWRSSARVATDPTTSRRLPRPAARWTPGAWHRDAVRDGCGTGLGTPPEWRDEERRGLPARVRGILPFEWHLQWMDPARGREHRDLPRYQPGGDDFFILTPFDLAAGLRTGFHAIEVRGRARRRSGVLPRRDVGVRLRRPRRGMGCSGAARRVFAGRSDPRRRGTRPLDLIENTTKALLLVGDHDDVVGQDGARELLNGLVGLPASLKELRTIRTTDDLFASHEAPTVVRDPVVRRTFWVPLDRLVATRRGGDGNA